MSNRQKRIGKIIKVYPVAVFVIGIILNYILGMNSYVAAMPSSSILMALATSGILLIVNHTWIMTSTELVRLKYKMQTTPEEWSSNKVAKKDIEQEGWDELERRHNAHRNTTENVVYFVLMSFVFVLGSPHIITAKIWLIMFAVARLGYTYSYLSGNDNMRGIFMTFSLLPMYGIASYLLINLIF